MVVEGHQEMALKSEGAPGNVSWQCCPLLTEAAEPLARRSNAFQLKHLLGKFSQSGKSEFVQRKHTV